MLEELYQELIIENAKSPKHRGVLGSEAQQITLQNPLCGDEVLFSMLWENGRVQAAKFDGAGCSISQASASLLADLVVGRDPAGIESLANDFKSLLRSQANEATMERLGDLVCLGGVAKYPARVRCAMLAFDAVERLIKTEANNPSQSGTGHAAISEARCDVLAADVPAADVPAADVPAAVIQNVPLPGQAPPSGAVAPNDSAARPNTTK